MKIYRIILVVAAGVALVSVMAYASFLIITKSNDPLAAVIPHHDLVKDLRQKFLKQLSLKSQPKTIVLVSVNHFNAGSGQIITSDQPWTVANGREKINADLAVIGALEKSGLVKIEPAAFLSEHGIRNLLFDIKEFFPKTKLVPLMIKEPADRGDIDKLSEILKKTCPSCGLLASVDMSHYQPAELAELHDVKTLRALMTLDEEEIWQTETDSNAALALLLDWSKSKGLNRFNLFTHTNSGLLAGDKEAETTTHILGNFRAGAPASLKPGLTFSFAGDAMFGRNVGYYFQKNNFLDLFGNLGERTLWGADVSWLNLEGPISDQEVEQFPLDHSLVFNFSHETIAALKYLKLTTVGLANNHTLNQGAAGLDKTREILRAAGIDWAGDPREVNSQAIKHYQQGDITVALVPVNVLGGAAGAEEMIREEKDQNNFVIVLPHWGNEYELTHSAAQEKLARAWFKAGADLIIGMHPHVVQDAQIIDGRLVFYSLGNFIFDQMFSAETQEGLIVSGQISADKLKIILTPVKSIKMKPEIMRGAERQKIIDHVCQNLGEYCKGEVITLTVD